MDDFLREVGLKYVKLGPVTIVFYASVIIWLLWAIAKASDKQNSEWVGWRGPFIFGLAIVLLFSAVPLWRAYSNCNDLKSKALRESLVGTSDRTARTDFSNSKCAAIVGNPPS